MGLPARVGAALGVAVLGARLTDEADDRGAAVAEVVHGEKGSNFSRRGPMGGQEVGHMTQGIGGYGRSNIDQWQRMQQEETSANKTARDYCTNADSVISGALCDEDTVISNACRTPHGDIDKTLCDDKQLHDAQTGVWQATKDTLKMIFGAIIGGAAK